MTKNGTIPVDKLLELARSQFVQLPVPAAIVDSGQRIALANSHFDGIFPNTDSIRDIPRHGVRVDGSTYEFDLVPLADKEFSVFLGRNTTSRESRRARKTNLPKSKSNAFR